MADGKFDNLPGKGKPLHLDETNPHADPEWELAYRMLKESGYSLPWIETIREIEKDIEAARRDLQRAWKWRIIYLSAEAPRRKATFDGMGTRPNRFQGKVSIRSTSVSAITTCRCPMRASSAQL